MFILRLISQPKVERNLLDKYHVGNWGFRHLLNNMVTKEWNVVSEYAITQTVNGTKISLKYTVDRAVDKTFTLQVLDSDETILAEQTITFTA